jgi:hypothetical protein
MITRRYNLGFVAVALLASVLALGCSASTANIGDAWMARDYEGTQRTTTFGPGEVFYCVAELKNAPDDTTVKASWTAVNAEGVDPNTFIDEAVLTSGSGSLHFELSNNSLWPNGQYKVDLYLNDELDRTLEFEVR